MSRDLAHLAQEYRAALKAAHDARISLTTALVNAQGAGAKVADLMDATGYSRRRIHQLLADGRKEQ